MLLGLEREIKRKEKKEIIKIPLGASPERP
jgi:hypothetical protein